MNNIKRTIEVSVSYTDFYFEDIEEATAFAETAIKAGADIKRVTIDIRYEKEDGEDEV